MSYGIIYKATCGSTKKSYVGQTVVSLTNRKAEHINGSKNRNKKRSRFQDALHNYSPESFMWKELCVCKNVMELSSMEDHYIKKYNTLWPNGYNMISNTNGWSEESRRKLSESKRGENNHFYGKKHSKEARRKMSKAHKGKKFSEETKRKMSESRKGEKNPMYGKPRSDDVKMKLSKALKGKKISKEARAKINKFPEGENNPKAIYNYTLRLPDGTIYKTGALASFCKKMNFKPSIISQICNNKNYCSRDIFYKGWTGKREYKRVFI